MCQHRHLRVESYFQRQRKYRSATQNKVLLDILAANIGLWYGVSSGAIFVITLLKIFTNTLCRVGRERVTYDRHDLFLISELEDCIGRIIDTASFRYALLCANRLSGT
jgi:hypothetical protein